MQRFLSQHVLSEVHVPIHVRYGQKSQFPQKDTMCHARRCQSMSLGHLVLLSVLYPYLSVVQQRYNVYKHHPFRKKNITPHTRGILTVKWPTFCSRQVVWSMKEPPMTARRRSWQSTEEGITYLMGHTWAEFEISQDDDFGWEQRTKAVGLDDICHHYTIIINCYTVGKINSKLHFFLLH